MDAETIPGVVVEYDNKWCRGKVLLLRGDVIDFHSTCFQSKPPTRFPKVGDVVKVAFNDRGGLISVREQ